MSDFFTNGEIEMDGHVFELKLIALRLEIYGGFICEFKKLGDIL